ncbi:MAG TPA: LCP family protein [Ktedonobacterales bacterium]|jgi:LCP family protein required for cell wall assembly
MNAGDYPRREPSPGGGLFKRPFPLSPDEPAKHPRQTPLLEADEPAYSDELAEGVDFRPPGRPGRVSRKPRRRARRVILKTTLAVFLLASCSSLAFLGARLYHLYTIAQTVTGKALPTIAVPTNVPQPTALAGDLSNVPAFNLLLLGSDNDAKFGDGAVLTQTDIVVRVDLTHHKITMVSIPRDMYIKTDYGVCCLKLDEISNNADGMSDPLNAKLHGFAHTAAAIEADFGIPIHAFAWVGLAGFVKVIDTLGGVDVDVLHPILDDAYPKDLNPNGNPHAYQRLYIPAGPQHLNGVTALQYVRSRHSDGTGDFGRSARQQSVLVALKRKLDNPAILGQLDELASDLQGSVLTSLTIPQIIWLANWAKGLPSNAIVQKVLSAPQYGRFYDVPTAGGSTKSVIMPNWAAINQTIRQIFPDAVAHVNLSKPSGTDAQTIQTEGARILIENGSGVSGVASKLTAILKRDGFKVVGAQDADRVYLATQLEQYSTKAAGTADILEQMLGVPILAPKIAGPKGADIVIIIGKDIADAIQRAS